MFVTLTYIFKKNSIVLENGMASKVMFITFTNNKIMRYFIVFYKEMKYELKVNLFGRFLRPTL